MAVSENGSDTAATHLRAATTYLSAALIHLCVAAT